MADTEHAADEENQKVAKFTDKSRPWEFKEAAFLLSMWSILVMNEGVIRFVQRGIPGGSDLFGGSPNRFWAGFLGGLFEVIFGMFGLCVGLAGGVLNYFSRKLMYALLVVQTTLGWYVFIDYVFVIPSYGISEKGSVLGMSTAASRAIGVFGILTSVAWCLSLQGGQFIFICRMMAFGGEDDFLKQRTGARMRAIFWNMNYAISGLWPTISAAILIRNLGGGLTAAPFQAPPNVGRIPVYLLFTGLLMIIWPLGGVFLTVTNNLKAVRQYAVFSFFVFLFVHVHYTIGQLGFISGNPAPPAGPAAGAAMHNHLAFMLSFLGPYFMLKHAEEAQA